MIEETEHELESQQLANLKSIDCFGFVAMAVVSIEAIFMIALDIIFDSNWILMIVDRVVLVSTFILLFSILVYKLHITTQLTNEKATESSPLVVVTTKHLKPTNKRIDSLRSQFEKV